MHRGAGRFDAAIGLLAESQDWDAVVATIRDVEIQPWARSSGPMYGRWCRMLPSAHRQLPAARFAAAIEVAARQPLAATTQFAAAAAGFRAAGDVDGEVAVIFHDGLIRWWANDIAGIAELFERVIALAAGGSAEAATLLHIGEGAIAHINADSPGVLQALADVDDTLLGPGWSATVDWLRHVALRWAGDLDGAELVLDGAVTAGSDEPNTESVLARLQIAWLRGDVEHVHFHPPDLELHHRHAGNRYLHVEVSLELAAHLAWLGDRDRAQLLLDETAAAMPDMPGALTKVLRLIAAAGIAVDDGDEALATTLLEDDPHSRPGRPDNWYWRDRAALVLPYVLLPEHREAWDAETVSPTHRVGLDLARALVAARADDLSVVRRLHWPQPGLARAHLPRRWLAELVAARVRAGDPAPAALAVVDPPDHQLTIRAVGPLEVLLDGVLVDHPDLRRRRVRELLCLLVARRRARRDVMADVLWPDAGDARHNLRVTLNYLRGMLEPEHARNAPSYFLRADHDTVALHPRAQLHCDVWELAAHLDRADAAERSGDPRGALDAYLAALPMWRGEPYDDIADAEWVRDEQTRWRNRYGRAASRAGELLLADGNWREAVKAAEHAITADPTTEPAHALLVRAHLAAGDHQQARRALDACVSALADLDVRPSAATLDLFTAAEDGAPLTVR